MRHQKDEHCDVDPATDTCRGCGVLHGDPCPDCGGRGFHRLEACTEEAIPAPVFDSRGWCANLGEKVEAAARAVPSSPYPLFGQHLRR